MSARVARCHASDRWIACTDDKSRDGTRRERMPRRMRECAHSTTDDTELLDVKSRERERWVVMGVSCDVTGTPGRRRPPTRDGACGGPLSQDRTRVDAPLSHVFTHCSHITMRYPVPEIGIALLVLRRFFAFWRAGRVSWLLVFFPRDGLLSGRWSCTWTCSVHGVGLGACAFALRLALNTLTSDGSQCSAVVSVL